MKQLPLLFLLLPLFCHAQHRGFAPDTLPSGAVYIALPQEKSDSYYRSDELLITDKTAYKALFPDSVQAKLPKIDFARYELLGIVYCIQCGRHCDHTSCHRNACRFVRSWYLLEKKGRVPLNPGVLEGTDCYFFQQENKLVYRDDSSFAVFRRNCDSLLPGTIDFNKQLVLARQEYTDCNSSYRQEFYLDTVHRCLVWRTFVTYGGCAGLSPYTFAYAVPRPPEGYAIVFEEYTLPRAR